MNVLDSLKDIKRCCGCEACKNVCKFNALSIKINKSGFPYPFINKNLCRNCNKCAKVCPIINNNLHNPIGPFYAAQSTKKTINNSASGGMFAEFANFILDHEGIVYGCTYQQNGSTLKAVHSRCTLHKQLPPFLSSKYVQSEISQVFAEVKNDILHNKKVLFSGTPCQVSALNNFLGKNYNNLTTVDLICHGVPSPQMFEEYQKLLIKKNKAKKINQINFRDKKIGWGLHLSVNYNNKINYYKPYESSYYSLFLNGNIFRPSCYECPYACKKRVSDITIGDFWEIEKNYPELIKDKLDINKGISCLIINTNKGKNLIANIDDEIKKYRVHYSKIISGNGQLSHPSFPGNNHYKIMNLYMTKGYKAIEKYWNKQNNTSKQYIKPLIKKILNSNRVTYNLIK